MTPVEILKAAKSLIDTPDKWTQESYARNKVGISVSTTNSQATCFCSLGAILRVVGGRESYDLPEFIQPCRVFIASFNDLCNHEDVMNLFDAMITKLENGETL